MIKILTGWSMEGGSTIAFINLTNALNANGIGCIMYGVHDWHLDKCRADRAVNLSLKDDDRLIIHFFNTNWNSKPPLKRLIYSCHEKDIAPVRNINYKIFDKIHYVSKPQMEWHKVEHPYVIIPNVVDDLKPETKQEKGIAGIIGSIDRNKQTHVSIERALNDGMNVIIMFGKITDMGYYKEKVEPLMNANPNRILPVIYEPNKQHMYNLVSDVYLSSISETWSYIKKECELTNTTFHGTDAVKDNFEIDLTNEEIVKCWQRELDV